MTAVLPAPPAGLLTTPDQVDWLPLVWAHELEETLEAAVAGAVAAQVAEGTNITEELVATYVEVCAEQLLEEFLGRPVRRQDCE